jgi:hypothetical protein
MARSGDVPQPELAPLIITEVVRVDSHLTPALSEGLSDQMPNTTSLGSRQERQIIILATMITTTVFLPQTNHPIPF